MKSKIKTGSQYLIGLLFFLNTIASIVKLENSLCASTLYSEPSNEFENGAVFTGKKASEPLSKLYRTLHARFSQCPSPALISNIFNQFTCHFDDIQAIHAYQSFVEYDYLTPPLFTLFQKNKLCHSASDEHPHFMI